jgi:hypothetical protein
VPNGGARKAGIRQNHQERHGWLTRGVTLRIHMAQEGGLWSLMENCSSGETSVGMYKLKEAIEKFCSDLLASHRRKCDCALAGMATWRFSSR